MAITTFLMYEPIRRLNNHLPQSIKIIGCLWANLIMDTLGDEWLSLSPSLSCSLPLSLPFSLHLLPASISLSPFSPSPFSLFLYPSFFSCISSRLSPTQHRPLFFPQSSGNQENEIASTMDVISGHLGLVGVISPINESCLSAMPKRRYQGLRDSLLSLFRPEGCKESPSFPSSIP